MESDYAPYSGFRGPDQELKYYETLYDLFQILAKNFISSLAESKSYCCYRFNRIGWGTARNEVGKQNRKVICPHKRYGKKESHEALLLQVCWRTCQKDKQLGSRKRILKSTQIVTLEIWFQTSWIKAIQANEQNTSQFAWIKCSAHRGQWPRGSRKAKIVRFIQIFATQSRTHNANGFQAFCYAKWWKNAAIGDHLAIDRDAESAQRKPKTGLWSICEFTWTIATFLKGWHST